MKAFNKPKYFYRITNSGEPIPGTLVRLPALPKTGRWREVHNLCCEEPCLDTCITTLNYDLFGSSFCGTFDYRIIVNGTITLQVRTRPVFDGQVPIITGTLDLREGDQVQVIMEDISNGCSNGYSISLATDIGNIYTGNGNNISGPGIIIESPIFSIDCQRTYTLILQGTSS